VYSIHDAQPLIINQLLSPAGPKLAASLFASSTPWRLSSSLESVSIYQCIPTTTPVGHRTSAASTPNDGPNDSHAYLLAFPARRDGPTIRTPFLRHNRNTAITPSILRLQMESERMPPWGWWRRRGPCASQGPAGSRQPRPRSLEPLRPLHAVANRPRPTVPRRPGHLRTCSAV